MTNLFKWRHYGAEIILLSIRWHLRYALTYRDLEEMMTEYGLNVEHTTIGSLGKTRTRDSEFSCKRVLECNRFFSDEVGWTTSYN
jgi:transposase-like protein